MQVYGDININTSISSRDKIKIEYSAPDEAIVSIGYLHESGGGSSATVWMQSLQGGSELSPNVYTSSRGPFGGRFCISVRNATLTIYSIQLYD